MRNFLDCVKSRKRPNADIEAGHHTNTVCRLGNIAYRVGRTLRWDAAKEQIIGDAEANRLALGDLPRSLEAQGAVTRYLPTKGASVRLSVCSCIGLLACWSRAGGRLRLKRQGRQQGPAASTKRHCS